jgi:hypothetical protein
MTYSTPICPIRMCFISLFEFSLHFSSKELTIFDQTDKNCSISTLYHKFFTIFRPVSTCCNVVGLFAWIWLKH